MKSAKKDDQVSPKESDDLLMDEVQHRDRKDTVKINPDKYFRNSVG